MIFVLGSLVCSKLDWTFFLIRCVICHKKSLYFVVSSFLFFGGATLLRWWKCTTNIQMVEKFLRFRGTTDWKFSGKLLLGKLSDKREVGLGDPLMMLIFKTILSFLVFVKLCSKKASWTSTQKINSDFNCINFLDNKIFMRCKFYE